jgi:hypothetical protein
VTYEPGFDRCYKCHKVTEGIWQGDGMFRSFTCLSCFCEWIRKVVRAMRAVQEQ